MFEVEDIEGNQMRIAQLISDLEKQNLLKPDSEIAEHIEELKTCQMIYANRDRLSSNSLNYFMNLAKEAIKDAETTLKEIYNANIR